jgi:hypothetical protein
MNPSYNLRIVTAFSLWLLFSSCGDDEQPPVDCAASNLQALASNLMDATCGLENGSFQLTISGGTAPFEFNVAGSGFQPVQSGTTTVEGVQSGNHTLNLSDGNNCSVTVNINISNVNSLAFTTELLAAGCQTTNGTITITASGGKEPYSYSLDGGTAQSENSFSGLGTGDYTTLVTEDDGCQTSVTISVLSGVSYNNVIAPIITAKCAISSACHDGTNGSPPDWTDLATVQASAEIIKSRTADGSMPPPNNTDPTPDEIQAIACWVDDGALNN